MYRVFNESGLNMELKMNSLLVLLLFICGQMILVAAIYLEATHPKTTDVVKRPSILSFLAYFGGCLALWKSGFGAYLSLLWLGILWHMGSRIYSRRALRATVEEQLGPASDLDA